MSQTFGLDGIVFRSSSLGSQMAAARAGLGLALLPNYMVSHSGLATTHPPGCDVHREVWLMVRRDIAQLPAGRALIDYLVAVFDDNRDILS
ncbi:LysR substrate-binding domain-containing protein [Roseospira visakhapatnamensis]|uniref:DNA-binding transcriptional LysR family regulator n=1 Tax=Roseospira visakhapatnamensis TaxID=390880 RepID=A0A7W6RFK7_9PROT|nr:LysR substrate-binding domain-containing protein [Roseospira visakhapatnamensis]MBB4267119.1 DNA-binding transcriptional LysR family regulator [Roseospira visakhapatnamensis]